MLLLGSMLALVVGAFRLLGSSPSGALPGWLALAVGAALGVGGLRLAGGRVARSRYRPDPWMLAEWGTVTCAVAAALIITLAAKHDPALAYPIPSPQIWPAVPVAVLGAMALAALVALISPPPHEPGLP
jgi:energy-coupling factor transport system permease protein